VPLLVPAATDGRSRERELNWIWLQVYAPNEPVGVTGRITFDHVVVAKSHVGCLRAAEPTGWRL